MNVMVTCGSSIIMGDVVSLLREIDIIKKIYLVDAEKINFNHGCTTFKIPYGKKNEFPKKLFRLVEEYDINYIYIGSEEEALALSSYEKIHEISHIDCRQNISLVLNKFKLHQRLSNMSSEQELVPYFQKCESLEELSRLVNEYKSIISRPITGRGSRGLQHIITRDQKKSFLKL